MPPAFTLEPRRKRSTSQSLPLDGVPIALGYPKACDQVDRATTREQIADALVEYARGRCDALVVCLIRDGNALGWRAYVAPPGRLAQPIEEVTLPLGGASSLQSAHDAGQTFNGAPPSAAHPVEKQLWSTLHSPVDPTAVLVVPILVKQRPVNLIYAHLLGTSPPRQLVTELEDLAGRAQSSYQRLIREVRGS
jgi:hypothetical protein